VQSLSQLYHTAWTMRDGAPAPIDALAQTTDGFLWLGSSSGLFRFDGFRFELFDPPAGQSMPSANVSALLSTPDSGLWVGYRFGGVSLIRRGTITSYGEAEGLPRGSVLSFDRDRQATIWVGATGGLARLQESRWHTIGPREGLPEGAVTAVLADRKGRIWVSADAGVFRRADGATRFERVAPPLNPSSVDKIYTSLREAPDGSVWGASEESGLRQLAPSDDRRDDALKQPASCAARHVLVERRGAIWLSCFHPGGIERVWPPRGASQRGESQRLTAGLSSDLVNALLEDREGNVWAGTTGGLDQFRRAKLNRVELAGLEENIALAPADSGAVWVGSRGRPLLRVGESVREFPEVARPVEVAYRDRAGVVWVGGPAGLWRTDGARFVRVALPDIGTAGLQAVTEDAAGDLWISVVRRGVYRRSRGSWALFGDRQDLPREPAIVLTTDDSGRTWFGYTANRVARLQGDSVHLYTGSDGLSVGNVLAIQARGTHVWVGGELGLALLVGDRFRPVTGRNRTAFRGTSGIVETPEGEVWLNGTAGISRIPAAEVGRMMEDSVFQVAYERLDYRDGLEGTAQQIRPQPTAITGTDGKLWFATTLHLGWIDPRAVPRNPVPPPVVIRRLTSGQTVYPIGPDLRLPVNTKALRIDYTAPSLSIPERVRFRYQLVGSDTAWQDAGGRREAFYTNLEPGDYRFRVIAANDDGLWNETGAAVDFTIPPSFTQSRWFVAVWVALLAGLAWLAYLVRMRQVAGGLRVRYQAALAERSRIAQELHDTLLQGFTGITLQLRAIERMLVQRPGESAAALKRVLASADTALRDARHMIWDLRAVELEGRDLATALETAARQAMAASSADLSFSVRGEPRRLPLALETTALRVGREAVLNAVKHASPHRVEVSLEYGTRSLTLHVVDDGTGIPPGALDAAAAGEHLGIAGMRDRARRAGGTLEIATEPGRGTTVRAILPLPDAGADGRRPAGPGPA
jgi:signal transduction histidine kinase/ligand-binding sensor domain-containing protein